MCSWWLQIVGFAIFGLALMALEKISDRFYKKCKWHYWVLANHKAGIAVSNSGCVSEIIQYPFYFDHEGSR